MISYEELKALPKDEEYKFKIFDIIGSVYVRITYNEDFQGGLYLDIMNNGFCDGIFYSGKYCKINCFYKLNKTNYNNILKEIEEIKKYILKNISKNY